MATAPAEVNSILLNGNPVKKYEKLVDDRMRQYSKKRKNNGAVPHDLPFDAEEAKTDCRRWLDLVKERLPQCYDYKNKRKKSCTCLNQPNSESLATYMVYMASQPKKNRQIILKGIVHTAEAIGQAGVTIAEEGHNTEEFKRPYRIPFPDGQSGALCVVGIQNLFCIREAAWKAIRDSAKTGRPGPIPHRNIRNTHPTTNSRILAAKPHLRRFLREISDTLGEPYATRWVREMAGIGIRDAQIDIVELPSSTGQRPTDFARGRS